MRANSLLRWMLFAFFALTAAYVSTPVVLAQGSPSLNWMYRPITDVYAIAYTPGASRLILAGDNLDSVSDVYSGTVEVWSGVTATTLQPFNLAAQTLEPIQCEAISNDGSTLAVAGPVAGSSTWSVQLWSMATGQPLTTLSTEANGGVGALCFSPQGTVLAIGGKSASGGGVLELWNLNTSKPPNELVTSATRMVNSVAFSPDGKTICSGGVDTSGRGISEVWNASSAAKKFTLDIAANESVHSVAFTLDGTMVATAGTTFSGGNAAGGFVHLWLLTNGSLYRTLSTGENLGVNSLSFCQDGATLAVGGGSATNGGYVEQWRYASANAPLSSSFSTGQAENVDTVAYSPDGSGLAVLTLTGQNGNNVGVWNASSGKPAAALNYPAVKSIARVAYSIDGSMLATADVVGAGTSGYALHIRNAANQIVQQTLNTAATASINSLSFSSNGVTLAVGGQQYISSSKSYAGVVEQWNVQTATTSTALKTAANYIVSAVAYSPDGTILAIGGQSYNSSTRRYAGVVELWNTSNNTLLHTVKTSGNFRVTGLALTSDNKTLAVGGATLDQSQTVQGGMLGLYSVSTGALLHALTTTAASGVNTISISNDDSMLAAGGSLTGNATLEIWSVSGGTLEHFLTASNASIANSVAFTPDNAYLFAGLDAGLQIFSVASHGLAKEYDENVSGGVNNIAMAFDGSLCAYVCGDATLGMALNPFVPEPKIASLTLSEPNVAAGGSVTGTVTLVSAAPLSGAAVSLSSSKAYAATVPASVTVPPGATSATFVVNAQKITTDTSLTITASLGPNNSLTAPLTVFTGVFISSVTIQPTRVTGGAKVSMTVTLSAPAHTGGALITLSSTSDAVAPPPNFTIAAGQTSGTVSIPTIPVYQPAVATVVASYNDSNNSASVEVEPPVLTSISLNPTTVAGGNGSMLTATISGPAPGNGVNVNLTSDNKAVQPPATVSIPAGKTSNDNLHDPCVVGTTPVQAAVVGTITGSFAGGTAKAKLTVTPPALKKFTVVPDQVTGGVTAVGTVVLTGPAPTGGSTVTFSSNAACATVPQSILIPAGSNTANINITTKSVTSNTAVTISASCNATTMTAPLTVLSDGIVSVSVNPTSVIGGLSFTITATLAAPAPSGGVTVALSTDPASAQIVTVPATLQIAAGKTSGSATATTNVVTSNFTATIYADYGGKEVKTTIVVAPAILHSITVNPATVPGGKSSVATVTLAQPAPTGGLKVTLSSNTSVATLPASITIPAGQTSGTATINTTTVTNSTVASIAATADGTSVSTQLTIDPPTVSVSISPSSVTGGTSATATITLSGAAPAGGAVVTLSSNSQAAAITGSVTVAAGQTSTTTPVTTSAVTTATVATISATYQGITSSNTITVNPATLASLSLNPSTVSGGNKVTGTVTLTGPAASATTVSISSAISQATVPASVLIPKGASSVTFTITTTKPASGSASGNITATLGSTSVTAKLTVTQ